VTYSRQPQTVIGLPHQDRATFRPLLPFSISTCRQRVPRLPRLQKSLVPTTSCWSR